MRFISNYMEIIDTQRGTKVPYPIDIIIGDEGRKFNKILLPEIPR